MFRVCEERWGASCSVHLGNLCNATELGVPVFHFESLTGERVVLHALVVPRANRVQIGALGKLLELLGSLVHGENLLDTVVVVAHVVAVLENSEGTVDLIFKSVVHLASKTNLLIIIHIFFDLIIDLNEKLCKR